MANPKPPIGPFRWNANAGRFVGADGRFAAQADVRAAVESVIAGSARRMARLADAYTGGALDLIGLRDQLGQEIKAVHLALLAAGAGGWAALTPTEFGHVGAAIRTQYAYLAGFMAAIAQGTQAPEGIAARAQLYAHAARGTYAAALGRAMGAAGLTEELNIPGDSHHCPGCLAETARGWVPLGALVPLGARTCQTRCQCVITYRKRAA